MTRRATDTQLSEDIEAQPCDERIAALRAKLDGINLELLVLLETRGSIVHEIMAIKRAIGVPGHDPVRECQMIDALVQQSGGIYPRAAIESVFQAIFAASRALGPR